MKTRVQIIAPSSGCANQATKLQEVVEFLGRNNFNHVTSPGELFSNDPLPYYANTQEDRLENLRDALISDISSMDLDIIWAFRGGYGSAEIVDGCMNLAGQVSNKKFLIGFSDITAIHLLFNQVFNIPSLHAANLTTLNDVNIEWIKAVIKGEKYSINLSPLNKMAEDFIKDNQSITSKIIGGNLTVFQTMIGTKLHPETSGKILFLEDCNEVGYKITRMLNHLQRAGIMDGVTAILLGEFTGGDEHKEYAIKQFAYNYSAIPIFSIPCGHGDINHPLLLGAEVQIDANILEFQYSI